MPVRVKKLVRKSFSVIVLTTLCLLTWLTTSVALVLADEPSPYLYVDHQHTRLSTLPSGDIEVTIGLVNKGSETLVISKGTTLFTFVEDSVVLDNDLTIKESALIKRVILTETWRKHVGSAESQEFFGRIFEIDDSSRPFILRTDAEEFNLFKNPLGSVNKESNAGMLDQIKQNARVMVSVIKLPITGVNTVQSVLPGVVKTITVIPTEPLGSHKRCTVVAQNEKSKTSLACDDGEQITIESTGLSMGTNAVILVHPENPIKVISTAETLIERMIRFQGLAGSQENPDLSGFDTIKRNVDKGFYVAQELAIAKAPPEVQALMAKLEYINKQIIELAGLFRSSEDNATMNAEDISRLASVLREFAASPDKLVDVMIDGYADDESRESKDELKTLIKAESAEFFSNMIKELFKAAQQLDAGDLEKSLYTLEAATAQDEDWGKNTVMPLMTKYYDDMKKVYTAKYAKEIETLRQDAKTEIEIVEKLLQEETDWMDPKVKTEIETTLSKLKEAMEQDDPEPIYGSLIPLSELIQGLPSEKQESEQSGGSKNDGSLEELIESAKSEIQTTETMLKEYADRIPQGEIESIRNLISGLEIVLTGNDREGIYSSLMTLVETLGSLSFGDIEPADPTNVIIQCPPKIIVGNELTCAFRYDGILKRHLWTAVFSGDNSQQTGNDRLFVSTYEMIGTVSLNLSVCGPSKCVEADHIIEIVKPPTNNGENAPNAREGSGGQQTSGGREGSEGHQTSGVHENNQGQQPSNGSIEEFSIEIECNTEIQIGQLIGCSFKHSRMPDKLIWSALGGAPSSGTADYFETSFKAIGQSSITLDACLGKMCKTDTQTIVVIPKQTEQNAEGRDSVNASD